MPLYGYMCLECGDRTYQFRTIANRNAAPDCALHHEPRKMGRIIEAPAVRGDYAGYACPVTGQWIEGRKAHEENLKKHGARVLEPGETEGVRRARAQEDADLERALGDTVEQTILEMPSDKRAALGQALESGADLSTTRIAGKVA